MKKKILLKNDSETINADFEPQIQDKIQDNIISEPKAFNKAEASSDYTDKELIEIALNHEIDENYESALDCYGKVYSNAKSDRETAEISISIGRVLSCLNKHDEALEYLNKSIEIFRNLNDKNNENLASLTIADVYNDSYKHDIALGYYHNLVDGSHVQENILIDALSGIGNIHDYRKEFQDALNYYCAALSRAVDSNDERSVAKLCFSIALIYDDLNDYDTAMQYYFKNIAINKDYKINPYLASSYANVAAIYEESRDISAAVDYYKKSLNEDKLTNNFEGQYKTLSNLGNIFFENGDLKNAIFYFHEELNAAKLAKDPYWIASGYLDLGDFYFAEKNYEKALKAFIMARKNIGNTISTDSKEKIDRRFRQIADEIGDSRFNLILKNLRRKDG